MKISKYIDVGSIFIDADTKSKDELLDLMIEAISRQEALKEFPDVDIEVIRSAIYARERQASTGLGEGYAFPHARLAGLDDIVVFIATLKNPIEYNSFDGKPVRVACMILAPEENPTLALKFMSELVKTLSKENAQEILKSAEKTSELVEFFRREAGHIDRTVFASDIMRPPFTFFSPDTPLRKITHYMSIKRLNAVAITDENKKVIGQITCDLLFNYGMPDFFQSLKSVSFIDEFDPFEEYFSQEAKSTAKDLMSSNFSTMPPTATLLEVVFALTVKKYPKIYVVDNDKLIGVIDQSTVLDRIVNF